MDKIRGQISQPMMIAAGVGFVLGLIIGLVVLGWWLWPVQWTNAAVPNLRGDLQQDYLVMAINSYARNQNAAQAQERWNNLGENAQQLLQDVQANPPVGTTPEEIAAFTQIVQPQGQVPGEVPGSTGEATGPAGPFTALVAGMCVLTLLIAGLLAYLFLFRNRQPALAGARSATGVGRVAEPPVSYPPGQEPPIAQYLTTYNLGNDLYDDSFSINSSSGEFLGECGVGISETIGVGDPKKVTAFEVWLFDKNDIQTVTKVLMSAHAFNDPAISQRLASKGEPVLAEPGKHVVLETATLQLEARVVNMSYGQGALPQNSFFDQMTLELAVWPKA